MKFLTKSLVVACITVMFFSCSSGKETISREDCMKNSRQKVLVMPIANDGYGVTMEVEQLHKNWCFQMIGQFQAAEILKAKGMNPDLSTVSEADYAEIAKAVGADVVLFGTVHIQHQEYRAPKETGNSFGDGIQKTLANKKAGDHVVLNLYYLRISDMQTGISMQNHVWKKL